MPRPKEQSRQSQRQCGDVRLRGFSDRASFAEAVAWLDLQVRHSLPAEEVSVAAAEGRVLAEPISAPADIPAMDCAAVDGYALRSSETEGASDYNPLLFTLDESPDAPSYALALAGAIMVSAGSPLPVGADAVLPFDATQLKGRVLEIFAPVAAGAGMERRGQHSGPDRVDRGSTHSAPQDAGLLASAGIDRVPVVRLPRVRLVSPGRRHSSVEVPQAMPTARCFAD